ncbi:Hypothetical_protein [Hexamita inflata]|uniref:Hypothetical_protein n=1 Tax=Hexamita inflata TaxID=28002 RepID=A0AA86NWX8_9EUKA|nr:Hypothetical protein HINF_LOCUS15019 [Hexamita inflata]
MQMNRFKMTPMSIFSKPQVPRVLSFLSLCFNSAGIALIVTFLTSEIDSFGFMVGGMFCLFIGSITFMISLSACFAVKSFAYIMMPCCVSESERKRLEEQAETRTPMLNEMDMIPVVINQKQMQMQMINYQQQVDGFQNVQPTIVVQNPIQDAPQQQQFANQQQNVVMNQQQNMAQPYTPAPMQAPSAITAPIELKISPVM